MTFRDDLSVPSSRVKQSKVLLGMLEDGTDMFSRNLGN
jgi:hypothetical protein